MRPHWARTVTKLHRSLTLTVAFLQRSPIKLKSQADSYWLLTNLARQSPAKGCSARARRSENGGPVTTTKSTGGGHGKDNSKRCCAAHGTGRVGRPGRVRARSVQKPVRSVPARALLHARTRSKVACQARPGACRLSRDAGPRARARQALMALTRGGIQRGREPHHPPPCAA